MQRNPFKPPAARLDPTLAGTQSSAATWIGRILGAVFVLTGVVTMLTVATNGTRAGLGAGAIYLLCLNPILFAFAGVLVFVRSRHALAASIGATVVSLLSGPWLVHLSREWAHVPDSPFDYGQALSERLHRLDPGWIVSLVVIGFCMWDYRQRFASWRRDSAVQESPPVESA